MEFQIFIIALMFVLGINAHPAVVQEESDMSYATQSENAWNEEQPPEEQTIDDATDQALSAYTGFRQKIEFECPTGSALFKMYSYHDNGQEDRRWRFDCKKISTTALTSCVWTPNSAYDRPLIGGCSNGFAVAGFRSLSYNPGARDRQFSVKCCKGDTITDDCSITDYLNNWDAVLNYEAPSGQIISGVYSHHENSREDRRHVAKICKLTCF